MKKNATRELINEYSRLDKLEKPDIFDQIKKADIGKKLGIHTEASKIVEDALNFKRKSPRKKVPYFKKERVLCGEAIIIKREQSAYREYMDSPEWVDRKIAYYRNHEKQCAACLSRNKIHLHHMLYQDLGKELDKHLIPLCDNCHREYHKINGTKFNMIKDTKLFIRWSLKK